MGLSGLVEGGSGGINLKTNNPKNKHGNIFKFKSKQF